MSAMILIGALLAAHPTQEEARAEALERIEQHLDRFEVPGTAIVAIENCRPVEAYYVGKANLEIGAPVAADTLFEAASLSKTVFTWLVMSLVEEGVLDLDRPFADDGFEWPRVADQEAYARITPRHVLTHGSGLPNWAGDALDPDRDDPLELEAIPGAEFHYSGEGFQLLQAYVEARTGDSLETLFRARLGSLMPRSSFVDTSPAGGSPSRGYVSLDPVTGRDLMTAPGGLAAATLVTTAPDFAAFVGHVCERAGLAPATYEEMLRPQFPSDGQDLDGPAQRALGWEVRDLDDEIVMHTGNNGHYRAIAMLIPEEREGIVAFANGMRGMDMLLDMFGLQEAPAGDED